MLCRTLKSLSTLRAIRTAHTTQFFHSAAGTFVTLDSTGTPVTEAVKLIHGDPDEAYILIPPEIGYALRAGSVSSTGISLVGNPNKFPLTFFHDTQAFAHESSTNFPRLEIPKQLPRQTNTDKSPATLFLTGVSHEITLDGTDDAKFAEMATESYTRLKPSLDRLKNM